jgi:hypothetical protein
MIEGLDPRGARGDIESNGVEFRIDGCLQLAADANQERPVSQVVKVGRLVKRVHVLHTARGSTGDGTQVASLVLLYTNRWKLELPVVYGVDLRDCVERPGAPVGGVKATWSMSSGSTNVRFFSSAFANPFPATALESVHYVSSLAGVAPVLASMTIE